MNYEISEIIIDPAGKYRARVIINENISIFLKFDHSPSQEEINSMVENYLQKMNTDPLV
jgi:hypothetical protein